MPNRRAKARDKQPEKSVASGRFSDRKPLDALGEKIAKARGETEKLQEPTPESALGKGWRLVSELVAGLLVAGALGVGLDRLVGTSPLFLLIGIALGFAAGLLNVKRAMTAEYQQVGEADKPDE